MNKANETGVDNPGAEQPALIRASELAQYGFCRRAWWLTVVKQVPSQNRKRLARGRRVHSGHEKKVRAAVRWRQRGFLLIGAGGLFFVGVFLWLWLGG